MHYIDQTKTVETFRILQRKSISNNCCSFEFSIHQKLLKKYIYITVFHKTFKQLFSILISDQKLVQIIVLSIF